MIDNKLSEKDFYNILWNYFSLHANQRIQVFNFFIILECALIGGFFTVSQSKNSLCPFKLAICISIVIFSVVFYLLDSRTKNLVKMAENSIIQIEKKYTKKFGKDFMIFRKEKKKTKLLRSDYILQNLQSYRILFCIIFVLFAITGVSGIIFVLRGNL
ncbi:MAG: hypothetical protein LBG72_01400 [Spirochaetaceae bacterium]|jgi:hypothetical protein|nr:hypothetical protein [Spirochaetaceae bacterium]